MPREQTGGCHGGGGREGMNWEVGVSRFQLSYTERIKNKVFIYITENYIQYPLINRNGKEYLKKRRKGGTN